MDGEVNSEFDLLGNLVKKDDNEITIENTIGPNEDVIRISYRRGITAGDILVELDMANDFLLADAEGEYSLEDVISPSAELMLIPGSIAGAQQQSNIQKKLTELQKELYKILDNEFNAHYPNDIVSIQSLTKIASDAGYKSGCSKEIVLKFIQNKFGINKKTADRIYSSIWPTSRPKYVYNEIKKFIKAKDGTLVTTEEEWNKMSASPSQRKLTVMDEDGNVFYPTSYNLIMKNAWTDFKNQWKTEAIMRLFMEEIFGVKFPGTTLREAYGFPWHLRGRLRFDGFAIVTIGDIEYRIAFEYDGIQHDKYPNYFHRTELQFKKAQLNDNFKNKIVEMDEYRTVLIRLKARDEFTLKNVNEFEAEILQQFYEQTGIRLLNQGLVYNPISHSVSCGKIGSEKSVHPSKILKL